MQGQNVLPIDSYLHEPCYTGLPPALRDTAKQLFNKKTGCFG